MNSTEKRYTKYMLGSVLDIESQCEEYMFGYQRFTNGSNFDELV
jgi:hypothetical protein